MDNQLISRSIIYGNLRRTLKRHLLSSKSVFQINDLALKYFGIYNDAGELIGYQCPYSEKKMTNTKKIVLEHIISVNSGGGTTLFNCIPTLEIVNKRDEKGTKHLIEWWTGSKYWNNDAPQRLEKLVQYILESYEITFNQNEIGYDDIDVEELGDVGYDQSNDGEANLTTTQEEEQVESTSLISYYGFINDALNELKNYTDVSSYQFRLQTLVGQNFFGNIDMQVKIQEFLKEFIKNKFEFEDRTELRFVLNIDIESLSKSLENYSEGDMFLELEKRINNIEKILDNNNLSLYSFFEDKNVLNYLNKSVNELTNDDINNLVNEINICAHDKFNKFIDFVLEHNGVLPGKSSRDKEEKKLGDYRNNIQHYDNRYNSFTVKLSKEQLEYLHNSDYKNLREIYKTILFKAVAKRFETGELDIKLDYEDLKMVFKIEEYLSKRKGKTIEEQIELEREYKDYIVIGSQFNEFVDFVLEHSGVLPRTKSRDEKEEKLGEFRSKIRTFVSERSSFSVTLSKEQLEYLHNSDYKNLREIYKTILFKAVAKRFETGELDIKLDYEDLKMVFKIEEYLSKRKGKTIEEQIELEREYKDYIVIGSQFNEFVGFVLEHGGLLPSLGSRNEEEQKLGRFRNSIQSFESKSVSFAVKLSKEQLKYLHDSEYESLRDIYKTILFKTVEKRFETGKPNVKLDYEDLEMVVKIEEYLGKRKGKTIEEQIEIEREYKDYIVITSRFNEFIYFVLEHNGALPRASIEDEKENELGIFRNDIQHYDSRYNNFTAKLSKERLEYLHDSEYESLREIYKTILFKTVEKRFETGKPNVKLDYEDLEMVVKIEEYLGKRKGKTIEEQIELEKEYKNYIVIGSQFNEFVGFVLEHNGVLPNTKSRDEKEKKLGGFRSGIQKFDIRRSCFTITLSKEQLEYLHDSEYESLREIYKTILFKAVEKRFETGELDIKLDYEDLEMVFKIEEYLSKRKGKTLEEYIELERKYKDYIVIGSQFNEFVGFVLEHNGVLPNTKSRYEKEKKLGGFRSGIQKFDIRRSCFTVTLSKEQLKYLHDSEYESLREIYDNIMRKAHEKDYSEYIGIDKEIRKEIVEIEPKNLNDCDLIKKGRIA